MTLLLPGPTTHKLATDASVQEHGAGVSHPWSVCNRRRLKDGGRYLETNTGLCHGPVMGQKGVGGDECKGRCAHTVWYSTCTHKQRNGQTFGSYNGKPRTWLCTPLNLWNYVGMNIPRACRRCSSSIAHAFYWTERLLLWLLLMLMPLLWCICVGCGACALRSKQAVPQLLSFSRPDLHHSCFTNFDICDVCITNLRCNDNCLVALVCTM